ncbi:MAG: hypothetical protein OHK0046_32940 [Anaerolineae bacterium]
MYVCLGVPYFLGEHVNGRDEVAKIEASGFAESISAPWITVQPEADENAIIGVNRALAAAIAAHPDRTPIIFASDCTSALGAVKGLTQAHGTPGVLWVDAHGDFNTPETTPSGFLGGMPLAILVGRGDMRYMEGVDLAPLPERDVVITDARDLDPQEAVMLRESDVMHLPVMSAIGTAPFPAKPLYIHFDTDVVRLEDMPGMSYPAVGGPTLDEAAESLRAVAGTQPIAGILFSLWNDTLPTEGKSLVSTLHLARTFVEAHQQR